MKKNVYFVIDQLTDKTGGGLISSYINLEQLLKDNYNIKIISIFHYNCKDVFPNNEKYTIINKKIDINFPKLLREKKIFKGIKNGIIYFFTIHISKKRIKQIISDDDIVIVSSPSAAIFMPKINFILEIHTSYKYFFGDNKLGNLQTKLMTKPKLTIFRTKYDSDNAPKYLNPTYIYNFFDNSNIKRNNYLIKNKILFVGRLEKEKNPIRLLDIAKELLKNNNEFILDIYGSGSLEKELKEKIIEYSLEKHVYLKGFINDKNIYKNYSLLWLTSHYEGFPLTIVESKANGIPVVSTNWGNGVHEIIDNGKDGYIILDNDEFAKITNHILYDEALQSYLSTNAYTSFTQFSKEKAKERWLKLLNKYKEDN